MGKLPKSMQQQRKKSRDLRAQGSAAMKAPGPANKNINRQMRRKMQQQGLDGMEEIDARRVIIQCEDEDLIIESPQVIKVNQQGMEIYQVIGKAEAQNAGEYAPQELIDVNGGDIQTQDGEIPSAINAEPSNLSVVITEQDIQLVVMQTNVSPEIAEAALRETNGDLAKAIINLKTR